MCFHFPSVLTTYDLTTTFYQLIGIDVTGHWLLGYDDDNGIKSTSIHVLIMFYTSEP